MSAAVAIDWATSGPAPRRPSPKRGKRALRAVAAPAAPAYFAVQCMVCEGLGPLAPKAERGYNPAKRSGWKFLLLSTLRGWLCPTCYRAYQRLLPPATRADCIGGTRPCPRTLCRYHLVGDVSRKARADFELPQTCALDVIDEHDEGMTLNEIGALLGMTREGSRYILLNCVARLRSITGLAWDFDDADEEGDAP